MDNSCASHCSLVLFLVLVRCLIACNVEMYAQLLFEKLGISGFIFVLVLIHINFPYILICHLFFAFMYIAMCLHCYNYIVLFPPHSFIFLSMASEKMV